jgi:hypothetical protein
MVRGWGVEVSLEVGVGRTTEVELTGTGVVGAAVGVACGDPPHPTSQIPRRRTAVS